jgi:hypothetical protein
MLSRPGFGRSLDELARGHLVFVALNNALTGYQGVDRVESSRNNGPAMASTSSASGSVARAMSSHRCQVGG